MNKIMLVSVLILLLITQKSFGGIVFEENFDNAAPWTADNEYGVNIHAPGRLPAPAGYDGYREGGSTWTPNMPPFQVIADGVSAKGGTGKGLTVNVVSDYAFRGGGFYKYLGWPGYHRIFVRFSMKIPSNFCWQSNPGYPGYPYNGKIFRLTALRRPFETVGYDGIAKFPAADTSPTSIVNFYARTYPTYQAPAIAMHEPRLAPGYSNIPMPQPGTCGTSPSYCYATKFFPNDGEPDAITTVPATPPSVNGQGFCGDGKWHTYEYDHWLNSALGVADGGYRVYKDGELWYSQTNIPWVSAGTDANGTVMSLDTGWNLLWLPDNHLALTYPPSQKISMPFYYDDIVVYTPLTNADPLWASSPQDGRLPLNYAISGGATTYYVSPTGNDSDTGTSPQAPWQTVAKVNTVDLAAGDVVRFDSGDYGTTTLTPKTSGSAGTLITFTSYEGAATKPILRGGVNLNNKNYIKIEGLDVSSTGNAILIGNGSNNVVNNNTLYSSATSWVHAVQLRNGSHYNKIANNTISQASGNNDIINLRNDTDNNLIENNVITINNSHAAIDLEGYTLDDGATPVGDRSSNYNIIRGNTITGINGGGALINLNANSNYNVVDNNTLKGDASLSSYCNLTSQPALHQDMFKLVGSYNIARNNKISNYPCKDSMGIDMSPYIYDGFTNNSTYQHVYHNVITGIGVGATPLYLFGYNGGEMHSNVIKNNIIYNNGGTYWQTDSNGSLPIDTSNLQLRDSHSSSFFTNNLIWKSGYSDALVWLGDNRYTVAQANTNSNNWDGNLSVDPVLNSNTLLAQNESPVLNAGANLTTITSASGSGTSFVVADPYYFTDGNGITTGDVVKVNNQTTTITDINYATGTLTVSPSITWTQGMAANLPFDGSAPSIGISTTGIDTVPPTVLGFTLPATYSSLTVPITTFTASDNVGVVSYAITTSVVQPTEWSATPPATVTAVFGNNIFYAWVKDAAGNVSPAATATVSVSLPVEPTTSPTPRVRGKGYFKVR